MYQRKLHEVVERDSDDNAVIDCAVESDSSYIVSGDSHLTEVSTLEGIRVITPRTFVNLLRLD